MINKELIEPKSIAVIGASNDITKPGGKVLFNLLQAGFRGDLYAMNPKENKVQGVDCYRSIDDLPNVELAIIAIASKFVPDAMRTLGEYKGTKAFIVLSAGFSEVGGEGKKLEEEIAEIANSYSATLIGPNCIGVLNSNYAGVFAGPIPKLNPKGVDFVSGSGATAVFITEMAMTMGIPFSSIFSVGNSAVIGVEDVLKHWDETFDENTSSQVKAIYVEQIQKPEEFLRHTQSLINKGCRIAGIKSGITEAGSRAVSSHTGALAGSDVAVDALFRKAGIVRCHSREELTYTLGVFTYKELLGDRIAVVTHAGGPGVMLTDTLTANDLKVPPISGKDADELLSKLHHGSSVANPIDFLATGTAEQLDLILEYIDSRFDNIDASVVIFGTPGLFDVKNVYEKLHHRIHTCRKPIYPVLPSLVQAREAIDYFISLGNAYFPDEVVLGKTLANVYKSSKKRKAREVHFKSNPQLRELIKDGEKGYLSPDKASKLLKLAGIPFVKEYYVSELEEALAKFSEMQKPVVMKVIGVLHKTDVGGVVLNINDEFAVRSSFEKLMNIEGATGVLLQEMLPKELELFIGANKEENFGHIVFVGLGGIFVEIFRDVANCLVPVSEEEALEMIRSLKSYKLLQGYRGKKGVEEDKLVELILNVSHLLENVPEIEEMDINPLIVNEAGITAVDVRIKVC